MGRASRRGHVVRWIAAGALGLFLVSAGSVHAQERKPPRIWPGEASAASVKRWIVGAHTDPRTRRIAARFRARSVTPYAFTVSVAAARRFGNALRRAGLLTYAEPDWRFRQASAWESDPGGWSRGAIAAPSLRWPRGVEIAIVDDFVDPETPDVARSVRYLNAEEWSVVEGPHGTQVASVAAGVNDGAGVLGLTPGAPIASFGLDDLSCASVADAIDEISSTGIPILNLSLGAAEDCFTVYLAVQVAYGTGTLVVAAAGNEFDLGNPVIYPAAYPHVISVAAIDRDLSSAYFSSANAAVDVSAPGVSVPTALPPAFDTDDGTRDGFTLADGTSFAAPIVSGLASWVWDQRPDLSVGQLADTIRYSALDLAAQGWDRDTGWGIVNVEAALQEPEPFDDPREPNDGISLVDGSVFRHADPPIWSGYGSKRLRASADTVEDPLDVYRLRLPRRSRVRVTVDPFFGDPDLEIFDQAADSTADTRDRVCVSRERRGRTESCTIVWRGRRKRTAYIVVEPYNSSDGYLSEYRLRFRRLNY